MRTFAFSLLLLACPCSAANSRAEYVAQVIDGVVNQSQLPTGFKGMVIGYLDDFGPVYKAYGIATVDGSVPLDEHTLFGVGSLTKLFSSTLLAVANGKGLDLTTPVGALLPAPISATGNRGAARLVDLADHHGGLPKNEGHLFSSVNDLYSDFASDPITCNASTQELVHDCGCCDPVYMGLLGLKPTCGIGVANPNYTCPTHPPTQGASGWLYSNLAFEVMGSAVATWLGYPNWNQAVLKEITEPLQMLDTIPLESFGPSQIARAANHCSPVTRATNVNCQLLDWLPVGNAAGGLFSTAQDMLRFLAYNAYGSPAGQTVPDSLASALSVVHKNYESSPTGGQELGWQTFTLRNGELEHWKDGSNGPFNSWVAYVGGSLPRMVVLLDNSGASPPALSTIGAQILLGTGPSIQSVNTAGGGKDQAQNTWIEIKGANLVPANTPAEGATWDSAPDFTSGHLPGSLGSVSVTVNGKPASVSFYCSAVTSTVCSTDQINVLTPLDSSTNLVPIVVTNGTARSLPFTVKLTNVSPAFLLYDAQGHVAAQHADGSILAPTSLYLGLSTPAKPGEQIVLYAVGFGLPTQTIVPGSSTQRGTLPSLPQCSVGGTAAVVNFAGLISPGLYQINLTVPATANGEASLICSYGGAITPSGDLLAVQP